MKLAGCICVLLGCYLAGRPKAKTYASRLHWLEEWLQKLLFLQSEMRYAKTPLPELFLSLSGTQDKKKVVELFFARTGQSLFQGEESLEMIWCREAKELTKELVIDCDRTCLFGQGMTKVEDGAQVAYMQGYLNYLQQCVTVRQEDIKQQQKVVQTVSLAVGALLVLMLL